MKGASLDTVLRRLMEGTKSKSLSALGPALGVTSQAIYDAKKRGKIPDRWIAIAVTRYGMNAESLMAGDETPLEPYSTSGQVDQKQDYLLKILENLNAELAAEREERRATSEENRQLHRDKAELLREVGDLKAKVARLEKRQSEEGSLTSLFDEQRSIPSSSRMPPPAK